MPTAFRHTLGVLLTALLVQTACQSPQAGLEWRDSLGTFSVAGNEVAVAEGRGTTREAAIVEARSLAQRSISELRRTQVRSWTHLHSDETGTLSLDESIDLRSCASISNGRWAEPEIKRLAPGAYRVRVRFEVPSKYVRPHDHLVRIREEHPDELVPACEAMIAEAESFEPPDWVVASLALRTLLAEQPTLLRVQHLADILEQSGDPRAAALVLRRYQGVVQDATGTIDSRVAALGRRMTDFEELLDRLDRVVRASNHDSLHLGARRERTTFDRAQTLTGYVPAGQYMRAFWIDADEMNTSPKWRWRPDQLPASHADGELARVEHDLPDYSGSAATFALGSVRLLVLTAPREQGFPEIQRAISLAGRDEQGGFEARRLETFIDELREWSRDPGHQATIVRWEHVEASTSQQSVSDATPHT